MSDDESIPEPDAIAGALHPRHTPQLFGQEAAEAAFLDAYTSDRLHHAWLITGPRGVGKATLAWRIARFLLSHEEGGLFGPPASLDAPADHPVVRRMLALTEPRFALVRRGWNEKTKRLRTEITVDEVRKLKSAFTFAAADGGRRVTIVDSIDEMNTAAANAFLKLLEEPPENVTMLLISHQPGRLLPTIRSRCRLLRCVPLGEDDMAAALAPTEFSSPALQVSALAAGSVGAAVRLLSQDGLALYEELVALLGTAPGMDRARAFKLAESCGGRGKEERLSVALEMVQTLLHRLALSGGNARSFTPITQDEPHLLGRLSPNLAAAQIWAALAQSLEGRSAHARAVNLDPAGLVLDICFKLDATARSVVARSA